MNAQIHYLNLACDGDLMIDSTASNTLDLQVSTRMKDASRTLFDLKYRLDMDSRKGVLQTIEATISKRLIFRREP